MGDQRDQLSFCSYWPGLLGEIIALHGSYYHRHWGLDLSFETQEAGELTEFLRSFDPGRDGLWASKLGGRLAGCVAVDGREGREEEGARLRWFIVRTGCQGQGLGEQLLGFALKFCRDCGYGRVHLWTFAGLEVARHLYLRAGFQLTQAHKVHQWGRELIEQRYDLSFASALCRACSSII